MPGKRYDFRRSRRWQQLRKTILRRDLFVCQYCGQPATEVDHVVPVTRGGLWWEERNLKASCRKCNRSRGNRGRLGRAVQNATRSVFKPRTSTNPPVSTIPLPSTRWAPIRGDYSRKATE